MIFQRNWRNAIEQLFAGISTYLCMCWLKAIGGGWTASTRMHEATPLPCISRCMDAKDEFRHYMTCPILWQPAREALNVQETSFAIEHRLCLVDGNLLKLKLLVNCLSLYHAIRKDTGCIGSKGNVLSSWVVQTRATDLIKAIRPLIE